MKVQSVLLLALLVSGAVHRSDAQECNTTLRSALATTPELSGLFAVVEAAGLANLLDDASLNVTVFAPNNNAILGLQQLLNASGLTLTNVTSSTNNVAANIILYHVVTTPATAAQLVDGQVLPTLYPGHNLTVDKNATTVVIDAAESDATVVTPDIAVCRSYVHIIDDVLLPSDLEDIEPYTPPAPPPPGTPPTPPGTVTPPPPPPGSGATNVGSSMLMGVAAAVLLLSLQCRIM